MGGFYLVTGCVISVGGKGWKEAGVDWIDPSVHACVGRGNNGIVDVSGKNESEVTIDTAPKHGFDGSSVRFEDVA